MAELLKDIAGHFHREGAVVRVVIIDAQGSTPRGEGAAMIVAENNIDGTIGGGALEHDAIAHARALLERPEDQPWLRDVKNYPLGPRLGQCCGGHVRLLFERYGEAEIVFAGSLFKADQPYVARPMISGAPLITYFQPDENTNLLHMLDQYLDDIQRGRLKNELVLSDGEEWFIESVKPDLLPLFLYGAGHVGREVVRIFEGMAVDIVWVDTDESRFPETLPENVRRLVAKAPQDTVAYAPDDAFHIVMSYSHPPDLEICHAVLKRGRFRYLGLIGSETKRARFEKRLEELGIDKAALARLTCPIGAGGPASKEPAVIAISVAAEILRLAEAH